MPLSARRPLRQVLSCVTTDVLVADRETAIAGEP